MNLRQKSVITGALLGAVLGALGGYLFARGTDFAPEEEEAQGLSLRSVPPGDLVKVLIAIMTVLRGIAELGERI